MQELLHILSNPTRLRILMCLARKSKNVAELIGTCGLAQSAVSQHLGKLKRAGLVASERRGKYVYYKLTYPEAATLADAMHKFIRRVMRSPNS